MSRPKSEVPVLAEEQALAHRHRLVLVKDEACDELRIVGPDGSTRVTVKVTETGVEVHLGAADLALRTEGRVQIDAAAISLRGRESVEIISGADMHLAADKVLATTAEEQRIQATLGNVDIEANDDVALGGERILLNCDLDGA